ncbi:MAG TPA: hydantoinase B/oxoprolinase family protein [Armatimonadota bacterium]|nr:hydantoinase B/oxoprolinase family protein [Armatimonadota bacterium]
MSRQRAPAPISPIEEEVFRHRAISIAEEMGITLERTAYSPNIKERRDHSCAIFDARGRLLAQAAHIPVHLGAFPLLMQHLVPRFRWRPGDLVICNDPFTGGTHLPDVSLVSPVFSDRGRLAGFVANRAHHADIGGAYPGSMGPATDVYQEGLILPPVLLFQAGKASQALFDLICRNVRTPEERRGDLQAQVAANATGVRRFQDLLRQYDAPRFRALARAARRRSRRAVEALLGDLPQGMWEFTDHLDSPEPGRPPLPIRVRLALRPGLLHADFTGTAPQQPAAINATLAVTCSAVYYALICLLPPGTPLTSGLFEPVQVSAPAGSLVNAVPPAAVAGGNVETSQRLVDVVFGALAPVLPARAPAASQGTMNNMTLGGLDPASGQPWAYYETLGGGAGASPGANGISGVHCHMSNTRNTPAEALEYHYPLRVRRYAIRRGSGGAGRHHGGDGVVREIELLAPATAALLTDRRGSAPYGLTGGEPGAPGLNELWNGKEWQPLPGRVSVHLEAGRRLRISTPGGGGWGPPEL